MVSTGTWELTIATIYNKRLKDIMKTNQLLYCKNTSLELAKQIKFTQELNNDVANDTRAC